MNAREVNPLVHFSAGAIGGSLAVIITSPLELLKTRRQASNSSYRAQPLSLIRLKRTSAIATWNQLIKSEGYRVLFKGLLPSLAAVIPSKALFFTANAECRRHLRSHCSHGHVVNLTAGTMAGIINAFAMNPFWVIKTKLQLDERSMPGRCNRDDVSRAMRELWKSEKLKAFFRGSSASIVGSLEHGIYFLIYEELKLRRLGYGMFSSKMQETSYIPVAVHLSVSACLSKVISNTIIYPTEVIRTRLRQDYETPFEKRKYRKFWQTVGTIYREEGARGLYCGWTLQLVKTIPFTIITFLVYEACVHNFSRKPHQSYS